MRLEEQANVTKVQEQKSQVLNSVEINLFGAAKILEEGNVSIDGEQTKMLLAGLELMAQALVKGGHLNNNHHEVTIH